MRDKSHLAYCKSCGCTVKLSFREPPHHLYSALTLSLIAAGAATPVTAGLMGLVWGHRILSTRGWGCPHCAS